MVAEVVAAQAVTAIVVQIVPSPPLTLTAAAPAAVMLPRNTAAAEAIGRATEAAAVERAVRAVAKLIARVTTPVALVAVDETLIDIAAVAGVANVIVIDEALITAAVNIVGIEDGIEIRVIPAMMTVLVVIISAARDTAAVAATRAIAITSIVDALDPDHAPNRAAHTTPMRRRPRRNISRASVIEINIDIYIYVYLVFF